MYPLRLFFQFGCWRRSCEVQIRLWHIFLGFFLCLLGDWGLLCTSWNTGCDCILEIAYVPPVFFYKFFNFGEAKAPSSQMILAHISVVLQQCPLLYHFPPSFWAQMRQKLLWWMLGMLNFVREKCRTTWGRN